MNNPSFCIVHGILITFISMVWMLLAGPTILLFPAMFSALAGVTTISAGILALLDD